MILFQNRNIIFGRRNIQVPIMLLLKAKIVASTCVSEIFAIKTKGGIICIEKASGKIVDEVNIMKVKAETPIVS